MNTKKTIAAIIILFVSLNTKAQNNFFKITIDDSIKVFYNSSADITIEKYADFYRVASIDTNTLLFSGNFTDYDIKGNKIFRGVFVNGKLNGIGTYFYKNGNIKEHGFYKNGVRDSIWTFYYSDKQIEKIIRFENGIPYITSLFKKNGKQVVKNGTGKYSGNILRNNGKNFTYKIKGELVKDVLNGKWTIDNEYKETFMNGKFIEGDYGSTQQIYLDNILGYYCQENLTLFQNNFFCKSCIDNISWAIYKVTSTIDSTLYDSFLTEYSNTIDSLNLSFTSQIIEFKVNENGTVSNLNTIQTNRKLDINILQDIFSRLTWLPLQCEGGTNGYNYMMVVKQNSKIYLPRAIIITNDLEANFMIKQMNKNELFICK